MASIPPPQPRSPMYSDGSGTGTAILEVLAIGAFYIAAAHIFLATTDFSGLLPHSLSPAEQNVGAGFLAGGIIQIALVLGLSLVLKDVRNAILNSFRLGTLPAWGAAFIAIGIHVMTLAFFVIDDPSAIFELSTRNLLLSSLSASDGWTQEVIFRGYVIYRLARSGAPVSAQIVISALLFAAIHIGYTEGNIMDFISPMIGTAVLGGFFAWSVQLGRGALLPVVCAHILLIIIVQPWLALG